MVSRDLSISRAAIRIHCIDRTGSRTNSILHGTRTSSRASTPPRAATTEQPERARQPTRGTERLSYLRNAGLPLLPRPANAVTARACSTEQERCKCLVQIVEGELPEARRPAPVGAITLPPVAHSLGHRVQVPSRPRELLKRLHPHVRMATLCKQVGDDRIAPVLRCVCSNLSTHAWAGPVQLRLPRTTALLSLLLLHSGRN